MSKRISMKLEGVIIGVICLLSATCKWETSPFIETNTLSDWKTQYLERPCQEILAQYEILKSHNLIGEIDWNHLEQSKYVDADLWNLYDSGLISRMIIYNSSTVIISENKSDDVCGSWLVYTNSMEELKDEFIDVSNSQKINDNWMWYANQPIPQTK